MRKVWLRGLIIAALVTLMISVSFSGCAENYSFYLRQAGGDFVVKDGYNAKIAWAYEFLMSGDYDKAYSIVEDVIKNADDVREDADDDWYSFSLKEAYYLAAACTRFGDGTEVNYEKSGEYLMKAAELGHQDAQVWLGSAYRFGAYGFEKNSEKAVEWYTRAAEQGEQKLIQLMSCDACIDSYDHALTSLGSCYIYGEGVEKDETKAYELFRKAAELGNLSACFMVGEMYLGGIGVEKNEKAAFTWLRKAAVEANTVTYANACLLTGYCYDKGIGTSKDTDRALKFYKKALENAKANDDNELYAQGQYYMALHYLNKKDKEKYNEYIREAAKLGSEEAKEKVRQQTDEYTRKEMKEVFEKAFEGKNPNSSLCGLTVTKQLQTIGILKGTKECADGNQYFDLFKDNTETSGGYNVQKYSTKVSLQDFIKKVNDRNIAGDNTYIALCFKKGGDKGLSQKHGHVLLIHKIYDGKVYFVENWRGKEKGNGYMRCYTIEDFLEKGGYGYAENKGKDNKGKDITYYVYAGAIWFQEPEIGW